MVSTEDETFYIKGGKRFRVYSQRVFDSWRMRAVRGSKVSLSNIPRAKSVLGFRDGTLIKNYADGKMYLIAGAKRRHITNPDAITRLGLEEFEVIVASEAETLLHDEGASIG